MHLWQRLTPLYEVGEARAIVRLLLEEHFGISLADYLCGAADTMPAERQEELERMMRRLEQGEPVQYVLGTAVFCGHQFHVEPGVLIPRPETEELVGWVLETIRESERSRDRENEGTGERGCEDRILDIGTGSGCIAISIAEALPDADVEAWDISPKALEIARGNAETLGADVTFCQQDILAASIAAAVSQRSHFDYIVSNPPYICDKEKAQMARNVLEYEPDTALFVPDCDPLLFYRAIADYARESLVSGGWLFFEINPLYASDMEEMLRRTGFAKVEIKTDGFGKKRMIRGQIK